VTERLKRDGLGEGRLSFWVWFAFEQSFDKLRMSGTRKLRMSGTRKLR